MRTEFLKSVTFENHKVYMVYAGTVAEPMLLQKKEQPAYTKLYEQGGLQAVLYSLGRDVFEGSILLRPYSWDQVTTSLNKANKMLKAPLRNFLDTEHAGLFIATVVEGMMHDPFYNALSAIHMMEDLRKDPKAVQSICQNNPSAFNFADESIRRDKDQAAKYVVACAEKPGFVFPSYFANNKEIALLALHRDGRIFSQLGDNLAADQDVVRCAFDESEPRSNHETRPSLIANDLRQNSVFMAELVSICPDLRMGETPELLYSKELAIAWIANGNNVFGELGLLPKSTCSSAKVQIALFKRSERDPDLLKQLLCHLRSLGVPIRKKLSSIEEAKGKNSSKKRSKRGRPPQSFRPSRGRKR